MRKHSKEVIEAELIPPPTPQVTQRPNPVVIAAIEKELSTIPGFTGLTEAEKANPEILEQKRKEALVRMYQKLGRIKKAKAVAGVEFYNKVVGYNPKTKKASLKPEIKDRLLVVKDADLPQDMIEQLKKTDAKVSPPTKDNTRNIRGNLDAMDEVIAILNQANIPFVSEAEILRQIIRDDIAKKVAKEIPKPKPPKELSAREQKLVAAELKAGVDATLAKMGRNPDGSIKAKEVKLNDGRDADGNLLVQTVDINGEKKTDENEKQSSKMKKCPYCAEEILAEAVKCRYCGEYLDKTTKEYFGAIGRGFAIACFVIAILCFVSSFDSSGAREEYNKIWSLASLVAGGIVASISVIRSKQISGNKANVFTLLKGSPKLTAVSAILFFIALFLFWLILMPHHRGKIIF